MGTVKVVAEPGIEMGKLFLEKKGWPPLGFSPTKPLLVHVSERIYFHRNLGYLENQPTVAEISVPCDMSKTK